jgi:predicted phosphodiesterase
MRLALLSDIHGNAIALKAVLADIEQRGGVDAVWVLGDLVALGPDPIGVLECVAALPHVRCTRGNTDRYVVTGERPPPTMTEVQQNLALLPVLLEIAGTFAWTHGAVTAAGWRDWLADLPLEVRVDLPDGTSVLGVHATPDCDDGAGIHPALRDRELAAIVANESADVICVGHTHWPLDRSIAGKRIVNLGSISNPLPPDLRATYAILEADASGYTIACRRVEYDRDAVIAAVQAMQHPGVAFIVKRLRGQYQPWWLDRGIAQEPDRPA